MKKEIFVHFAFLVSLFIFISLFKGWFAISFWPLWLGGVVGTFLPDVDHLIYIYFFGPQEVTSQMVSHKLAKRDIWGTLNLLADTRSERTRLVFHTALFQIIFLVLTFLVVTSSGSVFGRGLVLAFSLHLSVDQIVDIMETGGLDNWFRQFGFPRVGGLDRKRAMYYWGLGLAIVLFFGFLL